MNKINLTQLYGATAFGYFGGTLAIQINPVTEKIQLIGIIGFAALSLLVFLYGTFAKGRVSE